jgi:serine/threonine protein kinase
MTIQTLIANDNTSVEFDDSVIIGAGTMKDVYFSPCRTYVVAFYRKPLDHSGMERLEMITGRYRENIFDSKADYWNGLFCWPQKIVHHEGRVGVVVPVYRDSFFFEFGSVNGDVLNIKGREKQGKWFASAHNQNKFLDKREKGDWSGYLSICLKISRAVRRLHASGLAHSDLSYKNVLVSPVTGEAVVIDLDGLVVPGKYPPDVVGTPDFIAPEVVKTSKLAKLDANKFLPNISTDRHALAVLIYNYLLLRHPLRGDKVHALNPVDDEMLSMGEKALFIEHPSNKDNYVDPKKLNASGQPWSDPLKIPYAIVGPYLKKLFDKAFIDGLHEPKNRPTGDDWERALIKTVDLIQPCINKDCDQKWYVFDNTQSPKCPFCGTPYVGQLPVINFYSSRDGGVKYNADGHRLMVYANQSLFSWHSNRNITPNERIHKDKTGRLGYFIKHNGAWRLVNEKLTGLKNLTSGNLIKEGGSVELVDGLQLLVGSEHGDRLFHVQMVYGLNN